MLALHVQSVMRVDVCSRLVLTRAGQWSGAVVSWTIEKTSYGGTMFDKQRDTTTAGLRATAESARPQHCVVRQRPTHHFIICNPNFWDASTRQHQKHPKSTWSNQANQL